MQTDLVGGGREERLSMGAPMHEEPQEDELLQQQLQVRATNCVIGTGPGT